MTRFSFSLGNASVEVAGHTTASSLHEHDATRRRTTKQVGKSVGIAFDKAMRDGLLYGRYGPTFAFEFLPAGVGRSKRFGSFRFTFE